MKKLKKEDIPKNLIIVKNGEKIFLCGENLKGKIAISGENGKLNIQIIDGHYKKAF